MKKRKHIPSIDGLRAISIILVLFGHSYPTVSNQNGTLDIFFHFIGNAHIGVMTFFVISGYLITYLLRNEWEEKGTINLRDFYLRRILRIFPAFYSYLALISLLVIAGAIATSWSSIISAATFSTNYRHLWDHSDGGGEYYWFVGHFWTLSLEEQFYLLWPLTLLTLGLHKGKRVAQFIIIACPFIRVISYFLWPDSRGQLGMMLHSAADPLMIGCLMALWEGSANFELSVKRLHTGTIPLFATLLAFVISPILTLKLRGAYGISVGVTIEAISIAVILLYVTRCPDTLVGRILNSKPAVFVGILSYSLYLWQQLFLTPLNTSWLGKYPLNLIACFIVALISHYAVERPFLLLKNRIFQTKTRPKITPVV